MSPLGRKLARDLRELAGPIVTIAAVVACGVSAFVSLTGTHRALVEARDRYYAASRMGDVFATAERVPEPVAQRLRDVDSVSRVETRVVAQARVPLDTLDTPAEALAISIPRDGEASLGAISLTDGRRPAGGRHHEVVLLDGFARAHGIVPGESITAILEGQERTLEVVGIATSPEWIFAVLPGGIAPDPARLAVLWMPRDALEAVVGLEGAFNDVVLELQAHGRIEDVEDEVDRLLDPYGAPGAVGLDRQISNHFLEQELTQVKALATFAPALFLGVAAFLLNVVLGRIVSLQRGVIATLKAVGYADGAIAAHYLALVSVIVTAGALAGLGLGAVLGRSLTTLYLDFFHLPELAFRMPVDVAAIALLVSLGAAAVGGLGATFGILRMTPAQAMQPPAPPSYRAGARASRWARALVPPPLRTVYRELARKPLRFFASVLGISASVGLLVLGSSLTDSMDALLAELLPSVQREDVTVTLRAPVPSDALATFRAFEGVRRAEGVRSLPARIEAGSESRSVSVVATAAGDELRPLLALSGERVSRPARGAILTDVLATALGVAAGDVVRVIPLEGEQRVLSVPVSGTVAEAFGMAAHMDLAELHRVLGERPSINQILLDVDPRLEPEVLARINELPIVSSASNVKESFGRFAEQSGASVTVFAAIIILFGAAITVGVIYNNARITLNARSRDLASMRVLGFSRREIGGVLRAELAAQMALSLPLGLVAGRWILDAMYSTVDPESFRMPARVDPSSYASAAAIAIVAALGAGFIVRRRLHSLDMIGVLKTRE